MRCKTQTIWSVFVSLIILPKLDFVFLPNILFLFGAEWNGSIPIESTIFSYQYYLWSLTSSYSYQHLRSWWYSSRSWSEKSPSMWCAKLPVVFLCVAFHPDWLSSDMHSMLPVNLMFNTIQCLEDAAFPSSFVT